MLVFDSVYLLSCPFLGWNVKTVAGSRSTMTLLNHRILRRSKELFLSQVRLMYHAEPRTVLEAGLLLGRRPRDKHLHRQVTVQVWGSS